MFLLFLCLLCYLIIIPVGLSGASAGELVLEMLTVDGQHWKSEGAGLATPTLIFSNVFPF